MEMQEATQETKKKGDKSKKKWNVSLSNARVYTMILGESNKIEWNPAIDLVGLSQKPFLKVFLIINC